MITVSERAQVMKKNFMQLHLDGYSIPEISQKHNLSPQTVYRHLQEIADDNGVKREDLLQVIRTQRGERICRDEDKKIRLDIKTLKDSFTEASNVIEKLVTNIDKVLEDMCDEK